MKVCLSSQLPLAKIGSSDVGPTGERACQLVRWRELCHI